MGFKVYSNDHIIRYQTVHTVNPQECQWSIKCACINIRTHPGKETQTHFQ